VAYSPHGRDRRGCRIDHAYCVITACYLLLLRWREGVPLESVLLVNHEDILAIRGRLNSMVNRHFGRIESGVESRSQSFKPEGNGGVM
jgi:hypothetical protein